MRTLMKQWLMRLLGYGSVAAAGYVGSKLGPDMGAAVGTAIGVVGGVVLNKAEQHIIPRIEKAAGDVTARLRP